MKQLFVITLLLLNYLSSTAQWKDAGITGGSQYSKPEIFRNYVFVSDNHGIYRSDDLGGTWNIVLPISGELYNNKNFILAVTNQGLYKSVNGENWDSIPVPLIDYEYLIANQDICALKYNSLYKISEQGSLSLIYNFQDNVAFCRNCDSLYFVQYNQDAKDVLIFISANGKINKTQINWPAFSVNDNSHKVQLLGQIDSDLIVCTDKQIFAINKENGNCRLIKRIEEPYLNINYYQIRDSLIILSTNRSHYYSEDKGDSWKEIPANIPAQDIQTFGLNKYKGSFFVNSEIGLLSGADGLNWNRNPMKGLPTIFRSLYVRDSRMRLDLAGGSSVIVFPDGKIRPLKNDSLWYYSEPMKHEDGKTFCQRNGSLLSSIDLQNWDTIKYNGGLPVSNQKDKLFTISSYYKVTYGAHITIQSVFDNSIDNKLVIDSETYMNSDATAIGDFLFLNKNPEPVAIIDTRKTDSLYVLKETGISKKILRAGDKIFSLTEDGQVLEFDFDILEWKSTGSPLCYNIFAYKNAIFGVERTETGIQVHYLLSNNWSLFDKGPGNNLIVNDLAFEGNKVFAATDNGVFETSLEGLILGITEKGQYSSNIQTIVIYPNPATVTAYVTCKSGKLQSARIYTMQGMDVTGSVEIAGNNAVISLEGLKGVYSIISETEQGTVVDKLVVY